MHPENVAFCGGVGWTSVVNRLDGCLGVDSGWSEVILQAANDPGALGATLIEMMILADILAWNNGHFDGVYW